MTLVTPFSPDDLGRANATHAIEHRHDHASVGASIAFYRQNVQDTAREHGFTRRETSRALEAFVMVASELRMKLTDDVTVTAIVYTEANSTNGFEHGVAYPARQRGAGYEVTVPCPTGGSMTRFVSRNGGGGAHLQQRVDARRVASPRWRDAGRSRCSRWDSKAYTAGHFEIREHGVRVDDYEGYRPQG
jgi:hypothetical protein